MTVELVPATWEGAPVLSWDGDLIVEVAPGDHADPPSLEVLAQDPSLASLDPRYTDRRRYDRKASAADDANPTSPTLTVSSRPLWGAGPLALHVHEHRAPVDLTKAATELDRRLKDLGYANVTIRPRIAGTATPLADLCAAAPNNERARFLDDVTFPMDPAAWDAPGEPGAVLYVLDGGVLWTKNGLALPDLADAARMTPWCDCTHGAHGGRDTPIRVTRREDDPWVKHGVAVAGVAAGTVDNDLLGRGVDGRTAVRFVQVLSDVNEHNLPSYDLDDLITAFDVVLEDLHADASTRAVVNCSLGHHTDDARLRRRVADLDRTGRCVVVAATGNADGTQGNRPGPPRFPARYAKDFTCVIGVGGSALAEAGDYPSGFAPWKHGNLGRGTTVLAPASEVLVCRYKGKSNGEYYFQRCRHSGTSFSAPMVAATVSNLWRLWPRFTPRALRTLVAESARSLDPEAPRPHRDWGWGQLAIAEAFEAAGRHAADGRFDVVDGGWGGG
ncbi:MAG: S8/S53 family peptidase [Alphaproteobacteria bacterium]|nr:S8/S53 family peptidase [Alphaproteobacteria bacterium]